MGVVPFDRKFAWACWEGKWISIASCNSEETWPTFIFATHIHMFTQKV